MQSRHNNVSSPDCEYQADKAGRDTQMLLEASTNPADQNAIAVFESSKACESSRAEAMHW